IIWVARWWGLPRSTPAVAGGARLYGPFIATQDREGPFRIRRIAPPRLAAGTNFLRPGRKPGAQPSPDFPLAKKPGTSPALSPAAIRCTFVLRYPRNAPMACRQRQKNYATGSVSLSTRLDDASALRCTSPG